MNNISDLEAFVAVVKLGSVSKAAKELRQIKSTISRRLTHLETELQMQLLMRSTRSLKLTKDGEFVFLKAQQILNDYLELKQLTADQNQSMTGTIKMTAPIELGTYLLSKPLAEFMNLHPKIKLELDFTDRTVNLIEENFDLALRAGNLADSTLKSIRVGYGSFELYASRFYLQKNKVIKNIESLSEHQCLHYQRLNPAPTWRLTDGKSSKKIRLEKSFVCNSLTMLRQLVLENAGIAIMPPFMMREVLLTGEVERVLPSWSTPGAHYQLVFPPLKYQPYRIKTLIEFLQVELKKLNT